MVPGPATEALGKAARLSKAYLVIGVIEIDEHGATSYNTILYSAPTDRFLQSTAS